MSSFTATFIRIGHGTKHEVFCWDDYFGRHNYGYQVDNIGPVLTEEQFAKEYVREEDANAHTDSL